MLFAEKETVLSSSQGKGEDSQMKCLSTKLATAGVCAVQIKYEDKASLFLCTIRLQFLHRLDFSSSVSLTVGTRRYLLLELGWGLVAGMGGGSIMGVCVCARGSRGWLERASLFPSTCDFSQRPLKPCLQ